MPILFFISQTTDNEIKNIIKSLSEKKSSGPCSIPVIILKSIIDIIFKPLSNLINMSFTTGILPDILKSSEIIPIHKKGDTTLCNNYMPISLILNLSKNFEK